MISIMTELCALTALASAGIATDDPAQWLERMADAVENLNYRGTFVYTSADTGAMGHMKIEHQVVDGKVYEKLTEVGNGREIVRDDKAVRCRFEGGDPIVVDRYESPLQAALPAIDDNLHRFYRFSPVERSDKTVAERTVRIIEVRPRDNYRYGYKLWLDERTAMPLQSALIDSAANIIERVMFTTIDIAEDASAVAAPEAAQAARALPEPDMEEGAWRASELPAGFRLTVARTTSDGGVEQEHYVYTDGLATVSVFVERAADDADPITAVSNLGSANAYVTTVDGYQITAVGEVPPSTVEMIGASLRRRR